MADKKSNEILEQQRRAHKEFLELKKMQQGELEAPPKPSEVAIMPKTPAEKLSNFWFQYKWRVLAIIFIAVLAATLVVQCANKTQYDLRIAYHSYVAADDSQTDKIADYLKDYCGDINGDGEVNIQVINCSFNLKTTNKQYHTMIMSKLQGLIISDQTAMLYITDPTGYEYLQQISDSGGLLEGEPIAFKEDFYTATESPDFGKLPEGLTISGRRIKGTTFENKEEAEKCYKAAGELLDKLEAKIQK